jgi:hypothetical protein
MNTNLELTVAKLIALVAVVAILTVGSCSYRQNVVVPLEMAKAGMCWQPVIKLGTSAINTYAPCKDIGNVESK